MALLFCDNFENWSSTSEDYPGPWVRAFGLAGGNGNVNASVPGVYRTAGANGTSSLIVGFPNNATVIVNKRVSFESVGSNDNGAIMWFLDGSTEQVSLRFQPNGFFAVYRGLTTAKLGESNNFYPYNLAEYLDIELKVTFHNTTGAVELRINGVTEINLTNQNTRVSSNNFANQVRIGKSNSTQAARPFFKQFILMDTAGSVMNDFIGPVDVTSLRPNADGEYDDWTANTGTRFAAVNQAVTDDDTTFVSSSTPGDQVTFQLGNLPSGVTDVFAVFPQMQIRREQGTTRICKFLMRSGIDDELGTKELAIGPTYAFRQEAITTSPFTTNAWDVAEVNGLELGVEITT